MNYRCYFYCMIPYNHKETSTVRRERRAEARRKLTEAGFETEYKYHFMSEGSPGLKAAAKARAQTKAAEILERVGLTMEVNEGTYL